MNLSTCVTPIRHAGRRLLRTPGFSAVLVALIGVTLASLLTLGTAAHALLWRPLPYPHGDRLVIVEGFAAQMQASIGFAPGLMPDLAALPQVDAIGGYDHAPPLHDAQGRAFAAVRIESRLLDMLGAVPLLGRMPGSTGDEDEVVLSESTWRLHHGGDPGVVGRSLDFDGTRLRVVGVMAADYRFPTRDIALWRPLRLTPEQLGGADAFNFGAVQALVRLKPGVDARAFDAALQSALASRAELAPMREFMGLSLRTTTLRQRWDAGRSSMLGVLAAAAAAVLLLMLANVGSLWMTRCLHRARELAVRSALGATPRRMMLELAHEVGLVIAASLLLALFAVPPGLAALEALGVLDASAPLAPAPAVVTVIAALVLGLGLAAALSLVPAVVVRRPATLSLLAQGMRAHGAGQASQRARRALVALQLALAVALLVGAGLLGRSVWVLLEQDVGFKPENLSLIRLEARPTQAMLDAESVDADQDATARAASVVASIQGTPGVQAVSYSNAPPFSFSESVSSVRLDSAGAGDEDVSVHHRVVGPGYFAALGMNILRGPGFAHEDANPQTPGVVVDQRFVTRHLAGRDALGARVGLPGGEGADVRWARIVGVVPEVRHLQLDAAPEHGTLYRYSTSPGMDRGGTLLVLRSTLPLRDLAQHVRELAADAGLRAVDAAAVPARMRASLAHRIPLMTLVATFALFGALLAGTGLFALVSVSVQQRIPEFGLRLALGAPPASLQGLALREGLRAALPGLALGIVAALVVGRLLAARLYQVTAADPLTLLAVVLAALLLVAVACLLPARRAARLDPSTTLRHD